MSDHPAYRHDAPKLPAHDSRPGDPPACCPTATHPGYKVEKQYAGLYYVIDLSDGERVARVGLFQPGPMVSVDGPRITSPHLARAIAKAMVKLANELDLDLTTRS